MANTRQIFLFLFSISFFCFNDVYPAGDHVQGQIIVALHDSKSPDGMIHRHEKNGNTNTGLQIARPISHDLNYWLLNFNSSINENELLKVIREDKDVSAAQFNYYVHPRIIPNDSLFASEWDWNNTGQGGGLIGADVDAPAAWDITTGGLTAQGDTIVVAVVDCGFYLAHDDLDFWKNNLEIPGNNIDDDNNGYIDDYDGWNGYGNDTIISCDHGTHVSGTVGARGNNGIGVTGVNWNVKVMPLQYGDGEDAGAIECYGYAYAMRKLYNQSNGAQGAFIVSTNASFGIDYGLPADHPLWCAMYDSLGSVGILSAGAGPNLNIDIDVMGDIPTTCPSDWLISVTNTTKRDRKNTSAGYGAINMDLGAPGTGIWSTIPNNQYSNAYTGTSMATPHVAGAVALMWAAACDEMITEFKNNPPALAYAMKNIMLANVDTLTSLAAITVSGGRLNLYKSLLGVQNYCAALGVKDDAFNQHVVASVYPNPAHDKCFIYSSEYESGKNIKLKLFDMVGNEILSETINDSPYSLNIADLPAGFYLLQIESGSGIIMKKLVKE